MKALLLIIVFVAAVYVYTCIRNKKRRYHTQNINTVRDFRQKYLERNRPETEEENKYTQYITKYNSPLDFIERDEFLKEVQESKMTQSDHPTKFQSRLQDQKKIKQS